MNGSTCTSSEILKRRRSLQRSSYMDLQQRTPQLGIGCATPVQKARKFYCNALLKNGGDYLPGNIDRAVVAGPIRRTPADLLSPCRQQSQSNHSSEQWPEMFSPATFPVNKLHAVFIWHRFHRPSTLSSASLPNHSSPDHRTSSTSPSARRRGHALQLPATHAGRSSSQTGTSA